MKIKYVVLDGEQKDKTIWRKFQVDKRIRVIVCQYQTANAGIDLFASDTIIYYEPTLRSNILEQSRDRIHRSGQKEKCSYIHLLTRGTVEVDIYRALAGYSDFSEALFTRYMNGYRRSYDG
jgi:SNF2 family DNA or RNA helicase